MDRKLSILIVDDDEGDRWQIRRAFKKADAFCECTETQDINEAIAACQANSFDCAVVDFQLPGTDGLAAITTLHDRYPYMPIIMSTGQGDERIATDAMKRGASDYIPKTNLDAYSMWRSIEHAVNRSDLERKLAEQKGELETFGRQLAMVFNTVGIGDWSWDIAKDEITAHRVVWAQYGSPGREGAGPAAWFRARQHPLDAEAAWREVEFSLQSRQPFKVEFRVIWPDGSVHWLACHGAAVVDPKNNVIQTHGLSMDITEHKLAQLQLAESEQRLHQQANAMPQIVWTSGTDGRMDSYNGRWYEYTGISLEETMKSGWQSAVHPDDKTLCQSLCQREFSLGNGFELECRLQRGSDSVFRWHLGRFVPYRDDHAIIARWFGTFTDIHEQKTAKERLEAEVLKRTAALWQLQKKEEELVVSLSEQTTLLKEVHHRVKNNLQIISSLLRMQSESLKDPAAFEALKESQNRIFSMALIHEQLYGDQERGEIDFSQFTATLVDTLSHSYGAQENHVTCRLNLSPVLLRADQAVPCGLILNELLTNALKYAYPRGEGGEILIELKETANRLVTLTVSDVGVGLSQDLDFSNVNSLGLTLVNSLTQQLGGTLTVTSRPGTTFAVAFESEVRAANAK